MYKYLIIFLSIATSLAQGEDLDISNDYIVEGACPFECCTYREWGVESETQLYKGKNIESQKVVIVEPGNTVQALTGDVHVRPLKLSVNMDHKTHRAGETIWLLNYLGEGYYRAWKNGELISVELPFSPYGKTKPLKWAKIEGKYQMIWWVKLEAKNGTVGWTNQVNNFSNMDRCA